jgi:hypothetical protein
MIKPMGIKTVTSIGYLHGRICGSVLLFLFFFAPESFGQLKIRPLHPSVKNHDGQPGSAHRTKEIAPLPLPFFDDFSRPLVDKKGNMFPDLVRWDTSYTVWINKGMAIDPPTINVATFDGLDSAGLAYNPNEIFLNGFTDSLTSRKIDLGPDATPGNPSPVLQSERNSVYISFFYQWRGNGEAPDDDDYLELRFMNDLGKWESVLRVSPDETTQRDLFNTSIVQVQGDKFFHDAFQFQFRSYGRQSGPYDAWNLDYIYLNRNRSTTDLSFPDRAVASEVTPLFAPFTAMPYPHFRVTKTLNDVQFDIKNLKNSAASTEFSVDAKIVSYKDETASSPFSQSLIVSRGVKGSGGAMEPLERVTVDVDVLPDADDPAAFDPEADSADVTLSTIVISGDADDNLKPGFSPLDFRVNDTIHTTYNLRNFYAYDDGSAEYAVELIETGNFLAYEFNLSPDLPDTLRVLEGIEIYFPPYGLPGTQNVDFYVFAQHKSRAVPGARLLTIPSYRISSYGVNQFQRIKFLPALDMDTVTTFYIGWKQPIAGDVLVGLDNSNDTGNKIFVNVEGQTIPSEENAIWEQNSSLHGSLMIRPVFGMGEVDPTTGTEEEPVIFAVYPNPSQGSFYIEGGLDRLDILSVTGQHIPFQMETSQDKTFVQLSNVSTGLYLLRIMRSGVTRTHKLLITR